VSAWLSDGRQRHDVYDLIVEAQLADGRELQTTVAALR
jgi:hypothetical protein